MSVVLLVDLVDTPSEQHPVIIITDQRYESYNPFAHIEERSLILQNVLLLQDIL